jgi:recombination protein RecA
MHLTPEEKEEQDKQLELAMAEVDRQYGTGSVVRLTDDIEPIPAISSGALTLDMALGIMGLPRGRVVEIYGPESSGKSTVALSVIAEAQKLGLVCLYVDAEQALDPIYAHNVGVNMEDLIIAQPDYGEKAFDIIEKMVGTGQIGVVIVDSVAALTPKAEMEADMESQQMGLQARMMAKGLRKISAKVHQSNTLVIFINQLREKIGVMFGNPETTPGGRALKFYCSIRLDLRKIEEVKNNQGEILGVKVKAKVAKNKVAAPYKIAEFDINFGKGIDTLGCIVDAALTKGVLTGKGWIKYNDENFAHGRANAILKLADDLDLAEEIKQKILAC